MSYISSKLWDVGKFSGLSPRSHFSSCTVEYQTFLRASRQSSTPRCLTCNERRAASRAAILRIVVGENHPFLCDPVDVWRLEAHDAHAVCAVCPSGRRSSPKMTRMFGLMGCAWETCAHKKDPISATQQTDTNMALGGHRQVDVVVRQTVIITGPLLRTIFLLFPSSPIAQAVALCSPSGQHISSSQRCHSASMSG
jgi:hypothetical protein